MGIIKRSFKRQIFVVFMAITLVMVIAGGSLTIQGFQARLKSDYEKRDIEQNQMINDQLQYQFALAENALNSLEQNEIIQNSLKHTRGNSIEVYNELYKISDELRAIASIEIYRSGKCMYSTRAKSISSELPLYYSALKEATDQKGKICYCLDPTKSTESGADLLIVKQITDASDPGFAIIRIEQSQLESSLRANINAKDGFMLTDRFFRPFCVLGMDESEADLGIIRKNLFKGEMYNSGIGNNVYINEIAETGLLCIYITPPALDESAAQVGYQILLLEVVISIVICLFAATRFSGYFAKPIGILSAGMKRFRKGDFDTRIELNREDEFEQLAVGFNKMTTQLKQTMEKKVEAEHKINETRIQMMQAQLNPHFLYNTLDTIKWAGKANHVPEVDTLAASLAGILRTSISGSQFCPQSKELELVENYCDIQKIRFEDRFDITIDVPEEIQEAIIPKLIMQPIVENAIIHGIDEMDNGRIYVAAIRENRDDQDILKISIQDNGKGISDEMLNALNHSDIESLKGHLGLNNVNTIIRLYYGEDYGVRAIRPSEGGTVMIITLPFMKKEPKMI